MNSKPQPERRALVIALHLILWFVIAIVILVGLSRVAWFKYRGLANEGITTNGFVTAKEPQNHRSVRYSYSIGQQSYSGVESVGDLVEQLNIGDKVTVYYLPADPQVSCLRNPKEQVTEEAIPVILAALVFPTFIVFILYAKGVLYRK